jgi:peptidoglycan hydrolase-like protein with peptidoglycan-binding domain
MRRIIFISITLLLFSTSAYADFSAGIDAYTKKDYVSALNEFKPLADEGNADAQFMLGYMYASGKGVLQDYIQAHKWFNLSAFQGNERAMDSRDKIVEVMTPEQIAQAQSLAREWKPKEAEPAEAPESTAPYAAATPTRAELIREIQDHLASLGYEPGPIDGQMGSRTRQAIREYQAEQGYPVDGEPSQRLLGFLRTDREKGVSRKVAKRDDISASPAFKDSEGTRVPPEEQTQEVIDRLKTIVKKGEEERRADSVFLSELKELISLYDWPWRDHVFHDNFNDRDITRNPAWNIASGDFWVDARNRLITKIQIEQQKESTQQEDTKTRILKGVLMRNPQTN